VQSPVNYYSTEEVAAAPAPRPRDTGGWRRTLAVVLVVAGCLMAPAALASVYVHRDIMDVDGYVATVTPVADDAAVQEAVADALAKQVSGALDADQALPGPLPAELGEFTGPLSNQFEGLTAELTLQAVKSSAFREFWAAANRKAHPILVDVINSKGNLKVTTSDLIGLDLKKVTADVTDLLAASGVALPDPLPKALRTGDVMLLDARPLAKAGAVILGLDRLYPVLPVATIALILAAVLVAPRRLRAAAWVGAGLTLAMVALEAGLAIGRMSYLDRTDDAGIPHAASAAIWGALTSDLRRWGWAVLIVGVAAAVAATLVLLVVRPGDRRASQPGPGYTDYLYLPGEAPHPGGRGRL